MQSHQSSFPSSENPQKLLGHRRRPSIGKSMPVTSLLLNFPTPTQIKDHQHRFDGTTSPTIELERPPLYFRINELNNIEPLLTNKSDTESCDDNIEDDYEILISENSSDDDDNKLNNDKIYLLGNSKFYTPCLTCTSSFSSSSINNNNNYNFGNYDKPTPLKELCEKLCNNNCKNSKSIDSPLPDLEDIGNKFKKINLDNNMPGKFVKVPNKLDIQRNIFLNEMLQNIENSDNNNVKNNDDKIMVVVKETNNILKDNREKFMIAEALNKTSMMTSPAAKRRLAARKIEMELDFVGKKNIGSGSDDDNNDGDFVKFNEEFIPPRDLLMYLVRMGSFNSAPKINNIDSQDDNLELPQGLTTSDLIQHCKYLRGENRPQLLTRYFLKPTQDNYLNNNSNNDLANDFHVLNINSVSKVCSPALSSPKHLRILQWNILSQSLGQNNDGFVCCPDEALTWENRKFLIVEEILKNNPDIICLQEVDHYKFLEKILGSQGYIGIFFPKPDSPCLYIEENNGPDGCAIFYKRDKFELIDFDTRILEVWRVQSNQVAIVVNLRIRETDNEFAVCTTHLKARHGALLSKLRNEQGKDLLRFLTNFAKTRPILLCGDFNAEPIEPIYSTVLNNTLLGLSSAYADITDDIVNINDTEINTEMNKNNLTENCNNKNENNDEIIDEQKNIADIMAQKEPPYTTWKIREDGEVCHTIDYVFYSKQHFKVNNCLLFPQDEEIGKDRTPSFQYPSDHFSLVCDFEILDNHNHQKKCNYDE